MIGDLYLYYSKQFYIKYFSYPLPMTLKINKLQNKSTKTGTKIQKAAYSAAFSYFFSGLINPIGLRGLFMTILL